MRKSLYVLIITIIIISCLGISISKEPSIIEKNSSPKEKKEEPIETINIEEYTNDIVGTLYIPDTEFKATITQTTDNIYYLNHDVDGNSKSKGNPFLDYRDSIDSSKVLRIYGHNSRTISTEFHILEEYYKEKYYKEHPYIYFDTNEGTKKYQVFSSYIEAQDWSYYNVNFNNETTYKKELIKYKNKSLYNTGVEVSEKDRILILQTCSYDKKYAKYKNKFLLIMAKEV